jgi:type IV secretion system protein VirB4
MKYQQFKDKIYRRSAFSEMLGYACFLSDKTLMLKDGALQAVFRFYGDDIQATTENLQYSIAYRWSDGMAKFFNENVIIESDLVRKEAKKDTQVNDFLDITSALIDQERAFQFRQQGAVFESEVYITITWQEPKETATPIKKFIYETDEVIREKTTQERLDDFEMRLSRFIDYVGYGHGEKFERVKGDDYTSFLDYLITGKHRKVRFPGINKFVDTYISKSDFISSHVPVIGNTYIKVLSFDGFPHSVQSMLFDSLNALRFEFRYHLRYIRLTKGQADRQLKRIKRSWSSKAIGIKGVIQQSFGADPTLNEAHEIKKYETQDAIVENEDGQLAYGYLSGLFILYDEHLDNLNLRAKELQAHVENYGFILREELVHATDAYIGSLVGHGDSDLRNTPHDSMTWSMCLPLSSIYSGENQCPSPLYPKNSPPLLNALTQGSNIYRFSNFVDDVGHSVCLGPTGNGKTTLIELFLSQHRKYQDSRQIFIGKDGCGKIAALAHGGAYFDLDEDSQMRLSPIAYLDTVYEKELAKSWLIKCFEINDVIVSAVLKSEIEDALTRLSQHNQSDRKLSNLTFQNNQLRSAWHGINVGAFKAILNGSNDSILDNDCIGFDLTHILSLQKEVSMPILHAILGALTVKFQDCKPTLLILDEAWLVLDHPLFVNELKNWLKTLRKFNVAVIFSSQSLADVFNSPIAPVLIESCPTKIFLPNYMASESDVSKENYHRYGLNEAEIKLLTQATPKRQYYIVQPKGRRLVDIELGEIALKFLGVNPLVSHADNKRFFKYYDQENPRWILQYLEACKLPDAVHFVEESYFKDEAYA